MHLFLYKGKESYRLFLFIIAFEILQIKNQIYIVIFCAIRIVLWYDTKQGKDGTVQNIYLGRLINVPLLLEKGKYINAKEGFEK